MDTQSKNKRNASKPRIVIYGLGQYGKMIARLALDKGWPIIAVFNRAGPKVGEDLGHVLGLERDIGVVVHDSQSGDYGGIDADIGRCHPSGPSE